MIYHITTLSRWKASLIKGFHEADSLTSEGFIHASDSHQLKGVLERFYQDQKDLLLLHINDTKLTKKYQNINKFWCSALVSYIYVECGLLDKNIPSNLSSFIL